MSEEKENPECTIKHHDCPFHNSEAREEKQESLLVKNIGAIVAILISLGGWAYTAGTYSNRLTVSERELIELKTKVETFNTAGGAITQQLKLILDAHDKRINEMGSDIKRIDSTMSEMKSDIRVISEWVKEQKHPK